MPSVLITGANRGIGLELAKQYIGQGWQVLTTCRDMRNATDLTALSEKNKLTVYQLDVTDHVAIDELAKELAEKPIDVLINNAGIIGPVPIPENIHRQNFGSIDYDLWQQVLQTNTFAPVKLAEALLPNILTGDLKKIVTISSTVGSVVERKTPAYAYATSKAAVNKAMTLLAEDLRAQGVAVGLICPGYVKTRMDFGDADVEIPESAAGIRERIVELDMALSGTFRRFNGERIAW